MSKGLSVDVVVESEQEQKSLYRYASLLSIGIRKIKKILTGKVFKHFVNASLCLSSFKLFEISPILCTISKCVVNIYTVEV